MNYPDSVRYLYSLGNELKVGAKFGLERMQILLAELGNPERGQRFMHVAGTNGKGSTCAMIANAFTLAGFRIGLYTSPHLVSPTERVQVNGVPVSDEQFLEAFDTVHAAAEALLQRDAIDAHPSYFETVTAMALLIFREHCDWSVIEVGLGGRLDATNVITPELCVITPIAFDHESMLGNTLTAIAGEKAGILKPGVPVVCARQSPEAATVIETRAAELGCEVLRTNDAPLTGIHITATGSTFSQNGVPFRSNLRGRHQVENAAVAILACRHVGLEMTAIQAGLETVCWPGRLELVASHPDIILDGAHNPAGAAALADYIREFASGRPVWLVYAAMRDKAIGEVISQLFPLAHRIVLTAPDFPRALRPEAILDLDPRSNALIAPTVAEALAIARTAPPDALVFFSGSLFLIGEVKTLLAGARTAVS